MAANLHIARSNSTKCLALLVISILTLPISLAITGICILLQLLSRTDRKLRKIRRNETGFKQRTILVTGVGMTKGLSIARIMYLAGHRVVGADHEDGITPCSGRFSCSLAKFVRIHSPSASGAEAYVHSLVDLIKSENVDLWISCSGVATSLEDAQAKEVIEQTTSCKCIQFDVNLTTKLHEKDAFIKHTRSIGLPVPKTFDFDSQKKGLDFLWKSYSGKASTKYILKPIGMDDTFRGDMTLLPLQSWSDTETYIKNLPISKSRPWILQQFIPGKKEYCTHALVVKGQVRAFTSCPSSELLMHYRALPMDNPLAEEMFLFTKTFVKKTDPSMTGHLSFDFMLKEVVGNSNTEEKRGLYQTLVAIECNPRAHTAVVLFRGPNHVNKSIADAYISSIDSKPFSSNGGNFENVNGKIHREEVIFPSIDVLPRYWIAHDLVEFVLLPVWNAMVYSHQLSCAEYFKGIRTLITHILFWKEGVYETWDPVPFLILYHVYWPLTILMAWWRGYSWSRVNVSTTKLFAC